MKNKEGSGPASFSAMKHDDGTLLPPEARPEEVERVCHLVAKRTPPAWLGEQLKSLSSTLWISMLHDTTLPSRRNSRKRLTSFASAARLLAGDLSDETSLHFFRPVDVQEAQQLPRLRETLEKLAARAEDAVRLPELTAADGGTKKGRGRAVPEGSFTSHVQCAVIIAEAIKKMTGKHPAPRNGQAQEAAALLWKMAGGPEAGYVKDSTQTWRSYIRDAVSPAASQHLQDYRTEIARRLAEAERSHEMSTEKNTAESGSI